MLMLMLICNNININYMDILDRFPSKLGSN